MTITNQQRADRFQVAVTAYSDDETYANLVDLIADARHWCHLNGHSFDDALETAVMHFESETADEEIAVNPTHATQERTPT